ncbi:MAG: phytanoyl-CoA dioxygenase [Actinobacteria bacterium]|nr:phytanoyl-CoA dioxygenase [Actinomycetota bacterium]
MTMTSSELVNAEDIAAFDRDGAICLRQVVDTDWLDSLAVGLAKNFADPGPDSTVYTPDGEPGGFYDDYCNWQRIPEYEDFIVNSTVGQIAGEMMSSTTCRIYHEHVIVKEPGTQEVTPWHHDLPYYGLDGDQLCSVWLPLDPVQQSVCPQFVAGSHRNGQMYYPRLFISHENYGADVDGYATVPNIDAAIGTPDEPTLLSWDLKRGDCIVFHMRTLHGAPGTGQLTTPRRAFSTRWLGDDARFGVRAWATSPPFADVRLTPGEPMDHPNFPIVWQS